jgi:hypothetical protein
MVARFEPFLHFCFSLFKLQHTMFEPRLEKLVKLVTRPLPCINRRALGNKCLRHFLMWMTYRCGGLNIMLDEY